MMNRNQATVLEAVVSAIPHWYSSPLGPNRLELLPGAGGAVCRLAGPTPRLLGLEAFVRGNLETWCNLASIASLPLVHQEVQYQMALKWLDLHDSKPAWAPLLAYLSSLERRTFENRPVALNLVISEGRGRARIAEPALQKLIDPLASSPQVYLRVDHQGRLLGFEEIPWGAVRESLDHAYSPDFLQPFASTLQRGEYSVHQTTFGDLIFMDSSGMIAARRKGRWQLYDSGNFALSMKRIFARHRPSGNGADRGEAERVGANLFEVVFDLSYIRHGALLVYDPDGHVLEQIQDRTTQPNLRGSPHPSAHQSLAPFAREICVGASELRERKKRLLIGLASLDGAVIFNGDRILAFGAMVPLHTAVKPGVAGTRTLAALSAYRWGGLPVKISADGDVSVYFRGEEGDDPEKLEFF